MTDPRETLDALEELLNDVWTEFSTLNEDGTRQYRTCYLGVGRKNGKTEQGAGVATYLLVGDNEPGAQIYSCAGDRQQASLIYNAAAPMVRQSPALSSRAALWVSTGGGAFMRMASMWVPIRRRVKVERGSPYQWIASSSTFRTRTS